MGLADFFGQFLDDTPWTLLEKDKVIDDQLSDMLPYRVYDQENNFFHNVNSTGFILDVAPVINPDLIQSLQTALQDYCPRDGSIQFISWSSPNLHEQLSKWEKNRVVNTPLMKLLTSKRLEHFQNMRFGTDDPVKCVPHNRKILVVGWVDKISSVQSLKELENFRRNLTLVFGGEGHARNLPVTEFIDFLSEIFHSRGDRVGERAQYDPDTPLNYQVPGAGVVVNRNSLTFMSHPDLSVSSASVHIVPKKWGFQLGQLFHGAPEKVNDAPHGPVLISLTARSINAQKTNTDLIKRRAKIVHAEATNFHKFQPGLPDLKQEVDGLLRETEAGERLFETMTTVSAYARGGSDEAHAALGEMRKIWRSIGVTLQEDTFMQLPVFQTSLPFGMSGAIAKDMNRAGRLKKRKGAAVAHLAPLHGEWTGSGTSK
ncbi:MAG: TraC family protein, partial [Pseudoruegeria sp.]